VELYRVSIITTLTAQSKIHISKVLHNPFFVCKTAAVNNPKTAIYESLEVSAEGKNSGAFDL
jgi:hypothetical protein